MKKVVLSIFILLLFPALFPKTPVFATATECQFLEIGSTYTMLNNESSCQFFGTSDGVESGSNSTNTAAIVVPNGKQILIQNPDSSPQTITVGELQIQNGGSIVIPEGSQIIIGAPLLMKDTDNDGYVGSPNPQILREADSDYKIRRSAITHQEIDCNDNDANTNVTCVDVTPAPTMTPFPTYIQPSPTPTPTPTCKNDGEVCTINSDCCGNTCTTFYQDSDSDTYGNSAVSTKRCGTSYSGYVTNNTDCNDSGTNSANVYITKTCYVDSDNDDYGSTTSKTCTNNATCGSATWASGANGTAAASGNFSGVNTDCYDSNANAKPGQTNYYTVNRGDGSFDYDCDGSGTPPSVGPGQCAEAWASTYYTYCRSGCWGNKKGMGNRTCGASAYVLSGYYGGCHTDIRDDCLADSEEGAYSSWIVDVGQSCTISCR